jgi:hypothetical protein
MIKYRKHYPKDKNWGQLELNPVMRKCWSKLGLHKGTLVSAIIIYPAIFLISYFIEDRFVIGMIVGLYMMVLVSHIANFKLFKLRTKRVEMKKELKKHLKIWLIQVIGACFIISLSVLLTLNLVLFPTYIQKNNLIQGENLESITAKIEQISLNISNHQYIKGYYDCTEFSISLWQELKKINISSYCVLGRIKENGKWYSHAWIEVIIDNQIIPIEATGGFIIPDDIYIANYRVLKRGFCL